MLQTVLTDEGHIEALRQVEVELDRAQLPLAADGVRDLDVDLGAVERGLTLIHPVGDPRPFERLSQRLSRRHPLLRRSGRLVGVAGRQVALEVPEAEGA